MSLSKVSFTGDGSNRVFTLPFGYINKQDIFLTIDGNAATYVFQTTQSVKLDDTPDDGAEIDFVRATDVETPVVNFVDGANLTDDDLNLATRQTFYGLQELKDQYSDLVDLFNQATIVGGDLPVVSAGSGNTFLVNNNSGVWQTKNLAEVQTILGIDELIAGVDDGLPAVPTPGYPGVLAIDTDGTKHWSGIKGTRDLLNLGNLALHSDGDYPILAVGVGTDEGDAVVLEDVDGTPGLPAVDGSQLTGLGKAKYIRVDERKSFDDDGGTYPVSSTWLQRVLTSPITDETGDTTVTSGHLNVKEGRYECRVRSKMKIDGWCNVRLSAVSGAVIYVGQGVRSDGSERIVEVGGPFTLNVEDGLKVEVICTAASTNAAALGVAHGDSDLGPNIYTILELWKLP